MRQAVVLSIFLLLTSYPVMSYPIFFTCHNNQLTFQDKIDHKNLFNKLLKMNKAQRQQLANKWCKGSAACIKDFNFIAKLAKQNQQLAEKLFLETLKKYQTKLEGAIKISSKMPTELHKLKKSYIKLRACQEAKLQLNPEDFLSSDQLDLFVPYPYYSNYMFVTGCRGVDSKQCEFINRDDLDQVIEESIVMGVDPYLVLALSLMEGGTPEIGKLYLDPIGVMGAIGCSGRHIRNNSKNKKALNSFGTSYIVKPQIKRNKKLSKKLKHYFAHFDFDHQKGNSYFCYDTTGKKDPTVYAKPQNNSCCLELGFKTSKEFAPEISHALTYHYIDSITKRPFRKRRDPAWRIQRFNGYTNLMGAAEKVSPWRAGVNYYKYPAYGYQTMDFILNALMFNPYITDSVNYAQDNIKQKWPSILCRGQKDGTYFIDSEFYFNKHKNSKRLEAIYKKYKKGVPFNKLSKREKQVMIAELKETSKQNSAMKKLLTDHQATTLQASLMSSLNATLMSSNEENLFRNQLISKQSWKKRLHHTPFTAKELNRLYQWKKEEVAITNKLNDLSNKKEQLRETFYQKCDQKYQQNPDSPQVSQCYNEAEILGNALYELTPISKNAISGHKFFSSKQRRQINSIIKQEQKLIDKLDNKTQRFEQEFHFKGKKAAALDDTIRQMFDLEPLSAAIKRYKADPNYSPEVEEDLTTYYYHLKNEQQPTNYNKAYRNYFKKIYAKRDTIQKSSVFPWRRFNTEEAEKLVDKFDN